MSLVSGTLALPIHFSLFTSTPFLLFPALLPVLPPSPASFISAVKKLLTPLRTCKPERVKAFHKFFLLALPLPKTKINNNKKSISSDGFLKTHTHTRQAEQVLTALRS